MRETARSPFALIDHLIPRDVRYFQSHEVVSRYRDTQLSKTENLRNYEIKSQQISVLRDSRL